MFFVCNLRRIRKSQLEPDTTQRARHTEEPVLFADVVRDQDPVQDLQDRRAARPQRVRQNTEQEPEGQAAARPDPSRLHQVSGRDVLRREREQADAVRRHV